MTVPKVLLIPVIISMASGSISALASLTIIIMIRRSNLKLSTIYRRLFFSLSIFDFIQSTTQVLNAILMPKGDTWIAIGNDVSCTIVGFVGTFGISCSIWYSISISMYFLCVIKFEMDERKIQKCIEPFLHGIPILYSLVTSIYILSIDYFNSSGPVCWIYPPKNEDGEIDEGKLRHSSLLKWIVMVGPILFVFVCNCIILVMIWWTVYSQSKQMGQHYSRASMQQPSLTLPTHNTPETRSQNQKNKRDGVKAETEAETPPAVHEASISSSLKSLFQRSSKTGEEAQGQGQSQSSRRISLRILSPRSNSNLGPLAARLSQPTRGTRRMLKEISNRATAFIIGYILTNIFSMIYRIIDTSVGNTPFAIIILARFFFPLQGFFNILIYTYPHVLTYRRQHDGTSWIRAFWEVVKSGGDSDQNQPKRRSMPKRRKRRGKFSKNRRDSLRNEPVVVDVGESFMGDVERVRSNYNNSRRENRQGITFDSNDKAISNVEEGEQQNVDITKF